MIARLGRKWRAARESLRYEGLPIFLWRAFTRALSPIVDLDIQILFDIDLTRPIEARTPRAACTVEQVGEAELDELVASRFTALPRHDESALSDAEEYAYLRQERDYMWARQRVREEMLHAMRAGELFFVARVDGEIAHSNCIQFHGCGRVKGRPIRLLPGEVYGIEGYTQQRWRGLGLHEAVLSRMLIHAQGLGAHIGYTIADFANPRAHAGLRRVGWRRRGHHLFVRIGWVPRSWIFRLGGDIEPILRNLRGDAYPVEPLAAGE